MWNKNFLDNLSVASFYVGLMNYQENLTQSDKDDLIKSMSSTNKVILDKLEEDIAEQNGMLKEILTRLDAIEDKLVH